MHSQNTPQSSQYGNDSVLLNNYGDETQFYSDQLPSGDQQSYVGDFPLGNGDYGPEDLIDDDESRPLTLDDVTSGDHRQHDVQVLTGRAVSARRGGGLCETGKVMKGLEVNISITVLVDIRVYMLDCIQKPTYGGQKCTGYSLRS